LSDNKILCTLKDWKWKWVSRPNIAISEMASTLKDNWDNIGPYKGTVFTEQFIKEIQNFVDLITHSLHHLENKDQLMNEPPDADDVLEVLKAITDKPEIEDLFVDAFNTTGPILMLAIHVLVINCLAHSPDAFANQSVRAPATENFKAAHTLHTMMQYPINSILMRRCTVQRTPNIWDSNMYVQPETDQAPRQRQCRSRQIVLPLLLVPPLIWLPALGDPPLHRQAKDAESTPPPEAATPPAVGKCQERIVYNAIYDQVIRFIHDSHHGFLTGCSCTTQLLLVHHDWFSLGQERSS